MTDPILYILLHQYQHRERVKQAEQERLILAVSYPAIQVQAVMELKRIFYEWRARHQHVANENALVSGEVVMPKG